MRMQVEQVLKADGSIEDTPTLYSIHHYFLKIVLFTAAWMNSPIVASLAFNCLDKR